LFAINIIARYNKSTACLDLAVRPEFAV